MNNFICLYDLSNQLPNLRFIHCPYLIESSVITLLEMSKLLLQLLKLLGNSFIILSQLYVLFLKLKILFSILCTLLSEILHIFSFFRSQHCDIAGINFLSLFEHLQICVQSLLIQLINSSHILHAFLQYLHLSLESNFLLSCIICVFGSYILELLYVILFKFVATLHSGFLCLLLFIEQLLNFVII